jgi:DNA-binding IclR family transcriptional regulator
LLTSGAKSAGEIAAASSSHAPSVYRLLRALSDTGVFHQDGDLYSLTPLSELGTGRSA